MAFELHWLRRASDELDAIYQFYSEFASEQVAKRRIGKIIHSVDLLQTMPYLGRKDEEFTHIRSYRYLIILTYKVYYLLRMMAFTSPLFGIADKEAEHLFKNITFVPQTNHP